MVSTLMKIHNRGMFHLYDVCGCRVKNFQIFAYRFSIHKKVLCGRFLAPHSPHWAIQICQTQGSISHPLTGKNTITFCTIWDIFSRKQGGVQESKEQNQTLTYPISLTRFFLVHILLKKIGSNTFQFCS